LWYWRHLSPPPFEVFNHAIIPNPNGDGDNDGDDKTLWLSMQKTKGPSDLYVQSNTWLGVNPTTRAIASTGWHSHPGASLIIVTSGTITDYESDDPACKPVPGELLFLPRFLRILRPATIL
jgi:hypothetical protein